MKVWAGALAVVAVVLTVNVASGPSAADRELSIRAANRRAGCALLLINMVPKELPPKEKECSPNDTKELAYTVDS